MRSTAASVLVVAFVLVACGGKTSEPAPEPTDTTREAECVEGMPSDDACTTLTLGLQESHDPEPAGGIGGSLARSRWLVIWRSGNGQQLQLWARVQRPVTDAACTLRAGSFDCPGLLVSLSVQPDPCEANRFGLPGCDDDAADGRHFESSHFAIVRGSMSIARSDRAEGWMASIGETKIVEQCLMRSVEGNYLVTSARGRCYIVPSVTVPDAP